MIVDALGRGSTRADHTDYMGIYPSTILVISLWVTTPPSKARTMSSTRHPAAALAVNLPWPSPLAHHDTLCPTAALISSSSWHSSSYDDPHHRRTAALVSSTLRHSSSCDDPHHRPVVTLVASPPRFSSSRGGPHSSGMTLVVVLRWPSVAESPKLARSRRHLSSTRH
jgi:hypothetical protein